MASLQARHRRGCPRGLWTTAKGAKTGCTCGAKLTYVARYWDGGKNRQATLGRDLEEAKRELRDLEEKVDRKRRGFSPSIDRNITFAEWADQWLDGSTIKENTRRSYKPTIEIAKFVLGQRLVRSLDVDDVLAILEATKAPSESTKARHLRVLSACLQAALESGYADRNPARTLPKSFRPKRGKAKASYFTNDELTALWAKMPTELPAATYTYLCKLALATGARQGELVALRWGDVHQLDREIIVARSHTAGLGIDTTKSDKVRTLDLTDDALKVLADWTALTGAQEDGALVFPHPEQDTLGRTRAEKGSYLIPSTIVRVLRAGMDKAGVPKIGERGVVRDFHSLRHTFARIMLERGKSLQWVQRQLGHSSIGLTADVYGHWARDSEKQQAKDVPLGAFPL